MVPSYKKLWSPLYSFAATLCDQLTDGLQVKQCERNINMMSASWLKMQGRCLNKKHSACHYINPEGTTMTKDYEIFKNKYLLEKKWI